MKGAKQFCGLEVHMFSNRILTSSNFKVISDIKMAIGIHRMSTVTGSEVWISTLNPNLRRPSGATHEDCGHTVGLPGARETQWDTNPRWADAMQLWHLSPCCLSVCPAGWLAVCQISTHPVYDYDQNSLTYLLIQKKPGVNPTFVIRPINHLDSCCDFENSSYPPEVHETGSAVWNVGGWGQKRKPIHTRQTIRSPVRPAKWVVPRESETPFTSLDFGYEWSSMTRRTLSWLCYGTTFSLLLHQTYILSSPYHPPWQWIHLTLWKLTRRLMLEGARGPTTDPSYLWPGPWQFGAKIRPEI